MVLSLLRRIVVFILHQAVSRGPLRHILAAQFITVVKTNADRHSLGLRNPPGSGGDPILIKARSCLGEAGALTMTISALQVTLYPNALKASLTVGSCAQEECYMPGAFARMAQRVGTNTAFAAL